MSIIDSIATVINDFWLNFLLLIAKIFQTIWDVIVDFFSWAFSTILDLVMLILGAVNLGFLTQSLPVFLQIPDSVMNVLGLIGLAECMSIIAGAIIVRITLQLIPFTRLGS